MTDVKEKVGVLTDEISTAGRPIYKTPEGEMVSEKSTTFKYKGSWINIPTIYNGYSYDEEELRIMLDHGLVEPTSVHKNLKAAEKAAQKRSPTLRGFANGGSVEDQTGQAFKGMGYGEIIADNLIGLDNEYESLGEKIGKQFNQDEVAFLKKMGVGMYKGAKDFISAPIETTKEGFKEFATGTTNFLFKGLDTRLQEMFKTDYNNATPEQVTKARESVLGDAVIASGILPAGKVIGNVVEGAVDIGTNAARKIDLSKVNSAMARANEIAEDLEGKVDQSILGEGYRLAAKERMGKGRGKQNSAQTAAALNLGYTEIGFHSTRRYNPNEEIEVFKLPDEVFADRAADKGITLQELLDNEGLTFNNKNNAHDFLGVHVGTTKAAADRFSDLSFEKGLPEMEGSRTYQLRLKTNKPFLDGKKPWTEKGLNTFLVKEMDKIKSGQVYEKMQIVRRRLAEQGYTHVPYINIVEDKRNISYAMLVDRPEGGGVNSSAVIRYKDAEFNPLEKFNRNAKYAQGGLTSMDEQMGGAFSNGALVDAKKSLTADQRNTLYKSGDNPLTLLGMLSGIQPSFFSSKIGNAYSTPNLEDTNALLRKRRISPFKGRPLTTKQQDLILEKNENQWRQGIKDFLTKNTKGMSEEEIDTIVSGLNPKFAQNMFAKGSADMREIKGHEATHVALKKVILLKDTMEANEKGSFTKEYGESLSRQIEAITDRSGSINKEENVAQMFDARKGATFTDPKSGGPLLDGKPYYSGGGYDDMSPNTLEGNTSMPYFNEAFTKYQQGKPIFRDEYEITATSADAAKSDNRAFYNKSSREPYTDATKSQAERDGYKRDQYDDTLGNLFDRHFDRVGMQGLLHAVSDLTAKELGVDPMKFRRQQGLKINPLGAPMSIDDMGEETDTPQVLRSVRPVSRPEFNEGGTTMKDQMEMSFALGGVAETVDPVSGNDVPPGSLPEEVRDDIPARLSEGEYVVPADVVRYYGVKFFEDLRTQAKMGLQQMDADGRIGGEPMEPQQAELSDDDLNSIIEQAMQQEQPMMANEGGLAGYYNGSFVGGSLFGPQPSTEDGGNVFTAKDYKLELPKVAPITTAIAGPAYETKTFYKPDGTQVSVNFINGVPQQSIQGLSAKSPNEMDKVETYNPLKGAKLNALGQPVEEDGVTPIDMSRVGQLGFGVVDTFLKGDYERELAKNIKNPAKIKEQATQELEKSNNFFNGLGKIVLGIGGTILAGPVAGFAAAEGFDKYVTGQNIADAKVSQMVLEKQFNVNPVEVSRKVEAYTELTAAESAWNTINKKVISQTGTTNLDKILNKIGFGPQLADIEARYAALSPAEQQNKAAQIIAATDTSQSAARSAQEKRLNTARTKWAGQPKGNPSWNQTGPTEETYKKYENVGRQSERITANGQVMRTQADAFNQNRADDQSAASKRAGERAAYTASAAKRNQTAAEARDEFNANHADEIRTKYGGNKQTDSNGQDSGGTHCCTAAQARGDMTITEVKKLRAWHRQQDMFWQEGYDVWGKVIADNLVAKSKWQSDRVRDFYDHKIYGKRTIGSMYADVVIYPMSYIIGGYKVLKNTLKIKGTNYGN